MNFNSGSAKSLFILIYIQGKLTFECVQKISQLVWILVDIRVSYHACDILAVEVVVGHVDIPNTPVGVIVAVGAGTKRSLSPERGSCPMIVVMATKYRLFYTNYKIK